MFRKRTRKILSKFTEYEKIMTSIGANFFGQESKGLKQIRGNGVLILTEYELFFEMWFPKKEISIPIREITKIDNPKSHLKKTICRPLLKVWYINKLGEEDSVAWWIRDLESWTNTLNNKILNIKKF